MTVYHHPPVAPDTSLPDPHQDTFSKVIFGFWTYLMTDCLLFGTLFATYGVLHTHLFHGPGPRELFDIKLAFAETMVLLFSSLACGLAMLSAKKERVKHILLWLAVTWVLGASFIAMEFYEFHGLYQSGHSWDQSAFLSSFFTLVGTHGLHVSIGLIWMFIMICQVAYQGLNTDTFRRLIVFSLFWHFLDLIWVFIFTFVYLLGVA
ncbi:MAG: cytochrome o ubiquinol oxidase subunit III [Chlamydiia bacterium]|nr:cytochrome o ubiquinol oxidase subunit III [Chlamydiia bacterium]